MRDVSFFSLFSKEFSYIFTAKNALCANSGNKSGLNRDRAIETVRVISCDVVVVRRET